MSPVSCRLMPDGLQTCLDSCVGAILAVCKFYRVRPASRVCVSDQKDTMGSCEGLQIPVSGDV